MDLTNTNRQYEIRILIDKVVRGHFKCVTLIKTERAFIV